MKCEMSLKNRTLLAALGMAIGMVSAAVHAQTAPTRVVTVTSNAVGGGPDAAVRLIIEKVKENTGANIVIDPRPGGAGAPALQVIKRAPNDGHNLGVTYASAIALNPFMTAGLDIDPLKDFVPITNLMTLGVILSAREDFTAKNMKELIDMARAKPEAIKMGYAGAGNLVWLKMMEDRLGAKFTAVQFKSSSESTALALGGHIDVYFDVLGTLLAQKGKIKALAYGGSQTSPKLPGTPLVRDMMPGTDFISWFALIGPAGLAPDRAAWFHREFARAVKHPQVTTVIENGGMDPLANSPDEFARALKNEVEQNREIVRKFDMKS